MNRRIILPILLLTLLLGRASAETNQPPLASSRQMLLVTTKDWDTVSGTMRRFTRADTNSAWTEVGRRIPVVVGRNGLGWGQGLNPPAHLQGPVKKEGDGKSPAGIFRLSSVFGLDGPDKLKGLTLPYQQLTAGVECVDDVKSAHYNSMVDRARTPQPDWDGSEKMRAVGERYRLGIVVDHNTDPREAGGGSCIFIHIWLDARTGTSGCTAMAPEKMESLVTWLAAADQPVLVQLPEAEYKSLRKDWQLP